jgi:hypothetical protein
MGWVSGATGTADAANIGRAVCSGLSVARPCAVRSLSPAQLERGGWMGHERLLSRQTPNLTFLRWLCCYLLAVTPR